MIQQVMLNLLQNAAQAMAGLVANPKIVLRIVDEKNMVRIEVEDNGPGMKEAVRKRVFEPFFSTKPPGSGTGLGLAVSFFIITENHHGTTHVESVEGRGTKFVMRLPKTQNVSD